MSNLLGCTTLVTGGGSGIGLGCAQRLATAGAAVAIAGRRLEVLRTAARRQGESGQVPSVVVCHVTDEAQVRTAVERVPTEEFGHPRCERRQQLPRAISQIGAEAWDFSFRMNVIGMARCIKRASLIMRKHDGGIILAHAIPDFVNLKDGLTPT